MEIVKYQLEDGKIHFDSWLRDLRKKYWRNYRENS